MKRYFFLAVVIGSGMFYFTGCEQKAPKEKTLIVDTSKEKCQAGKCAEGKCQGAPKSSKCGEGKCGEGKCGGGK